MKIDKGSFINDFIDKNLRQYSIPVYQRNYEWSAEQCEKLFEDILQAHELDRFHFTGSVVYSLLKNENKIDYYGRAFNRDENKKFYYESIVSFVPQ